MRGGLINIATDGESYGHHEPFGDMCLGFFFKHLTKEYKFEVINYAAYLEKFPPTHEVVLKSGYNGEGTAWSCSHGVGRWKEDCGCSTYAGAGWNQAWRAPLREGLNTLRDQLWTLYKMQTEPFLKSVEEARHDYIMVFAGQKVDTGTEIGTLLRGEQGYTHLHYMAIHMGKQICVYNVSSNEARAIFEAIGTASGTTACY